MKNAVSAGTQAEHQEKPNGRKFGSYEEILGGLVGQVVTVVNPQSYMPTLTGYKIDSAAYKGKIVSCEHGLLQILIEFLSDPHRKVNEKGYQFIPLDQIKRVTISKSLKLITL